MKIEDWRDVPGTWSHEDARKKPIIIHAWIIQEKCQIETKEGIMTGEVGDILIQGVNKEMYPCKPDIFQKSYDWIKPPRMQRYV